MPTYDKAVLTEQARRLGFITAPFEKMTRLTEILRFMSDTDELRETLALKGGTAINLTIFILSRFPISTFFRIAIANFRSKRQISPRLYRGGLI